jgi:hypothetical protein
MLWTFLQNNSAVLQTIAELLSALITLGAVLYAVKQVNEAKKARVLSAYLTFESRLINERAREDRRYLYEHDFTNPSSISLADREILERICTTFDILGVLVREELMYRPLVFKPFYDVIIKCWNKALDFIEFQRKDNRRAKTYMRDFQYLFDEAEKYRVYHKLGEVKVHPPQSDKASSISAHRGRLSTKESSKHPLRQR